MANRVSSARVAAALLGAVAAIVACQGGRPPIAAAVPDYRTVRSSAAREILRGDSLVVEHLSLGDALGPGSDTLRFDLINDAHAGRTVGVVVWFRPGLWMLGASEQGKSVSLPPGGRATVVLPYRMRRLTVEGALVLRIGDPSGDSARLVVKHPVIERLYPIGRGNPNAVDPRLNFDHLATDHFDLYAFRGSRASRELARIAEERERAVRKVGEILGIDFRRRILVALYPDSATKRNEMGHIGMGWANDDVIVEIYNDRDRLDPFHEVTHVVAAGLGDPPAALNEGFATYVSELLGADALEHLGHKDRRVDEATCDLARQGRRIRLDSLFRLDEFGSAAAPGEVTYPQGASVVKHLIETYGVVPFREAYRTIGPWDAAAVATFTRIFGASPAAVDASWTANLRCS